MNRREFLQIFPLAITGWGIETKFKSFTTKRKQPGIVGCLPMCLPSSNKPIYLPIFINGSNLSR